MKTPNEGMIASFRGMLQPNKCMEKVGKGMVRLFLGIVKGRTLKN
jgi:hypothetical protein